LDYSVIGQVVNLAARLCGHAEPETIVVSTAVRDAVGPNAGLDFLDRREVKVRGVSGMVQVFSLAASSSSPNS
jgi:adenylate cyclase